MTATAVRSRLPPRTRPQHPARNARTSAESRSRHQSTLREKKIPMPHEDRMRWRSRREVSDLDEEDHHRSMSDGGDPGNPAKSSPSICVHMHASSRQHFPPTTAARRRCERRCPVRCRWHRGNAQCKAAMDRSFHRGIGGFTKNGSEAISPRKWWTRSRSERPAQPKLPAARPTRTTCTAPASNPSPVAR